MHPNIRTISPAPPGLSYFAPAVGRAFLVVALAIIDFGDGEGPDRVEPLYLANGVLEVGGTHAGAGVLLPASEASRRESEALGQRLAATVARVAQ